MMIDDENKSQGIQGPFLEMAFPKQPFLNGRSLRDKNRKLGHLSEASALYKLPKPANPCSHPLRGIRSTSKSSACNLDSGPVVHDLDLSFTPFHANFTEISRIFHGLLPAAAFQTKRNKNLLPRMKCKWGSLAAWKHVMHATTFIKYRTFRPKWWLYNHHFWTCRRLPGK